MISVVLLAIVDVLLATLFLLKSNWTKASWLTATSDFHFCTTSVDLWFTAISRFSLISGAIFGIRLNTTQGRARLRLSRKPIYCISFGIVVYVLAKFLASTECVEAHSSKVWFWLFLGHTALFSLTFSWSWWVMGRGALLKTELVVNKDQEVGSVLGSSSSESDNESVDSEDSSSERFVHDLMSHHCSLVINAKCSITLNKTMNTPQNLLPF